MTVGAGFGLHLWLDWYKRPYQVLDVNRYPHAEDHPVEASSRAAQRNLEDYYGSIAALQSVYKKAIPRKLIALDQHMKPVGSLKAVVTPESINHCFDIV